MIDRCFYLCMCIVRWQTKQKNNYYTNIKNRKQNKINRL